MHQATLATRCLVLVDDALARGLVELFRRLSNERRRLFGRAARDGRDARSRLLDKCTKRGTYRSIARVAAFAYTVRLHR